MTNATSGGPGGVGGSGVVEHRCMIERVALALYRHQCELNHYADKWDEVNKPYFTGFARAAIAAMREPTEEMMNAGWIEGMRPKAPREAWQAMIDAALKGK